MGLIKNKHLFLWKDQEFHLVLLRYLANDDHSPLTTHEFYF
jgi:hypothetical protein